DRQIRAVAFAVSQLDDSTVTAIPIGETRSNRIEYFLGDGFAQDVCLDLPASVEIIALAESDHLFRERPHFFGLRQSGHQAAVIEKVRDKIPGQRPPMRHIPAELSICVSMSHSVCSDCAGTTGRPCSSTFIPSCRPMLCRISLISLRDLRPKFLVLSISASVFVTNSPIVRILAFFRQLYERTESSNSSTDLFKCSATASWRT